ncbi:hypothetical protein GDO78_006854 [Eleutherodactylus coqui]|uniref:Uncharacterized protein n=1 Tax=Eleutherodactylus coqui TaxID=57060 RepID=A0A8J6FG20_ELECQ|nr:hypothetical protein GDO78_006854 [Eleutherodactylus coqui]
MAHLNSENEQLKSQLQDNETHSQASTNHMPPLPVLLCLLHFLYYGLCGRFGRDGSCIICNHMTLTCAGHGSRLWSIASKCFSGTSLLIAYSLRIDQWAFIP